jgi:hypothetical protein
VQTSQFAARVAGNTQFILTPDSQLRRYVSEPRGTVIDRRSKVDFVFLLALIVLYAATRWLIGAVSRLGGLQ